MTQIYHWPDKHREFAFRSFKAGATMEQQRSWTRPIQTWDISGNCLRPIRRELSTARVGIPRNVRGKQYATFGERYWRQDIEMSVRCRKCDNCRAVRAWQWRLRMKAEVDRGSRTWFTTLTLRPDAHNIARYGAIMRLKKSGVHWDDLHPDEQFSEILRELGPEVTKFIKRVRKNSAARFTYACVTEKHKSGLPHFHMLWHEAPNGGRIKWKHLDAAWRLGFSLHKLIPADQSKRVAAYVAKYLSKSLASRVRCSQGYGLGERHTASSDRIKKSVFPPDPYSSTILQPTQRLGSHPVEEWEHTNAEWRLSSVLPEVGRKICTKGDPEWERLLGALQPKGSRQCRTEAGLSNAFEPGAAIGTGTSGATTLAAPDDPGG